MKNRFSDELYLSYIKEIKDSKPMSVKEEKELLIKIKNGDQKAKMEFYYRHLKFVISIAKEYTDDFLTLSDLINEGNLGLIKSMERYDFTAKTRFMSYAVWWIRQCITHSINKNSRTIRIPENVISDIKNNTNNKSIPRCVPLLFDDESDSFDVSDYYIGDDDENEYEDDLKNMLTEILNKLSDKDREVIKMSFGIGEYDVMSLEEISNDMNLSKERVRQIKNNAIRKMKHQSKGLIMYKNI